MPFRRCTRVRDSAPPPRRMSMRCCEHGRNPARTRRLPTIGKGWHVSLPMLPGALLVAAHGSEVVETVIVGWNGWRGSTYRIAVAPTHRRVGLASTLLEHATGRLESLGARVDDLDCDVDANGIADRSARRRRRIIPRCGGLRRGTHDNGDSPCDIHRLLREARDDGVSGSSPRSPTSCQ
jgi:GNAT superfamily N-acetyltransferase